MKTLNHCEMMFFYLNKAKNSIPLHAFLIFQGIFKDNSSKLGVIQCFFLSWFALNIWNSLRPMDLAYLVKILKRHAPSLRQNYTKVLCLQVFGILSKQHFEYKLGPDFEWIVRKIIQIVGNLALDPKHTLLRGNRQGTSRVYI